MDKLTNGKLTLRGKTLIAVALFIAVFAILIGVASVFDLQISDILTKNALSGEEHTSGAYFTNEFFSKFGEIIGSAPIFLMAALVTVLLFAYFSKTWKLKPFKYFMTLLFFAGGVVAFWFFIKDAMGYILEHFGNHDLRHDPALVAVEVVIALIMEILAVYASKNISEENVRKLAKFALIAALALIISNAVVAIVKDPIGRMRYRAMNFSGEWDKYTPWYIANGQPSDAVIAGFPADDAFKSFPSGHTCAAGALYILLMLPDLINFKHKGTKYACYVLPVLFTGIIAISRVVAGAHFMSDVTFGGTIAFLSVMLVREIFICKGSHFKAVFSKRKAEVKTEAEI